MDTDTPRGIAKPIDVTGWNPKVQARFNAKWVEDPATGCHIWTANLNHFGYAKFFYLGRTVKGHRLAYAVKYGDPASHLTLDHLCRVRRCVNPDHLEPVTHRENVLRGDSFAAKAATTTHCPEGHPLVDGNLSPAHLRLGFRQCWDCVRAHRRETDRRTRQAQKRLGYTTKVFRAVFGQGAANTDAVLAGSFDHLAARGYPKGRGGDSDSPTG